VFLKFQGSGIVSQIVKFNWQTTAIVQPGLATLTLLVHIARQRIKLAVLNRSHGICSPWRCWKSESRAVSG